MSEKLKYRVSRVREFRLCDAVDRYCKRTAKALQMELFSGMEVRTGGEDVRVVELFAGVGGFRVGLERASERYKTVWNNQWEPSTKRQDASSVYQERFGVEGHSNADIATVKTEDIPRADLLVGGFPCQDYSVATTLKNSGGIEGKKGVLWWQIYRILNESAEKPKYLMLENVDRLLKSPASQRGRDFAIILASLSDLGYAVEWRVVNAADYGMPQRRKRTYMVGYLRGTKLHGEAVGGGDDEGWILQNGVMAKAFECVRDGGMREFGIEGGLDEVSRDFNRGDGGRSPFGNAGFMEGRRVRTMDVEPVFMGKRLTLGDVLLPERDVPEEFFIEEERLEEWRYLKGAKSETRKTADGYEYKYSEGAMAFPDAPDKPSRTIITGEGGAAPSRFKHVVETPSGRYRRLTPVELERLNMFPDGHTKGASDARRAFLMGNALVTGIVERIGLVLLGRM